jgi:predicted Rossmann fold nucleotide-binding protein DprA/Smf involved in DNA uptake
MHAKGLVVRLSWGVWVRRDRCGLAPEVESIRRNNPTQDRLLPHLQEPKTLDDLVRITGQSRMALQSALTKMMKRAVVERRDGRAFAAAKK